MRHNVALHEYAKGGKRKITVDGVTYNSRTDMLNAYDLTESTINRFKRKYSLSQEDAISKAIDYRAGQIQKYIEINERKEKEYQIRKEKAEAKKFTFRDKTYRDFSHCCSHYQEKYDIPVCSTKIRKNAKRYSISLQEELDKEIKIQLRKKIRRNIQYDKRGHIQVNTKEKADAIIKCLGDRIINYYTIEYRNSHATAHIIRYFSRKERKKYGKNNSTKRT